MKKKKKVFLNLKSYRIALDYERLKNLDNQRQYVLLHWILDWGKTSYDEYLWNNLGLT